MTVGLDQTRLDDAAVLTGEDPGEMLRAVASSAAQVRTAATGVAESDLPRLAAEGRPRALIVTGMGGSGIAGDVLASMAVSASSVPVVVHKGSGLPAWVGAADLVVAVSCSGQTAETLSATDEAIRRGARLLAVGAAGSPLAGRCEQARGIFLTVEAGGRLPRANLWALSIPVVLAAAALGLVSADQPAVEAAAVALEQVAHACRPDSDVFLNPAKALALDLAGTLPVSWGVGPLAAVAAQRLACQLNENSKYPASFGPLPEVLHNQVVSFDGPFGALAPAAGAGDLFRDRTEDPLTDPARLRLVLLRDAGESEDLSRWAEGAVSVAAARGVPVSQLQAQGQGPLERLASLVGLVDYASVYLALLHGIDPSPIDAITELKRWRTP